MLYENENKLLSCTRKNDHHKLHYQQLLYRTILETMKFHVWWENTQKIAPCILFHVKRNLVMALYAQ